MDSGKDHFQTLKYRACQSLRPLTLQSQRETRSQCQEAYLHKTATHKVSTHISHEKLREKAESFLILGGFLICGKRLINQGWFEFVAGAGNGPVVGVKASRNLTNKIFCNGDFTLNFRKNGIIPGLVGSEYFVHILYVFFIYSNNKVSFSPLYNQPWPCS